MFGSDWPVCLLSAGYERVWGIVDEYLRKLPVRSCQKILGENAVKFYRLVS
jgi:L-fuconolactonase